MWGSAVECRQRGGSAAPRHAARGAVGVFNQVDKFMGSEPWLRGSFVLSPPPGTAGTLACWRTSFQA